MGASDYQIYMLKLMRYHAPHHSVHLCPTIYVLQPIHVPQHQIPVSCSISQHVSSLSHVRSPCVSSTEAEGHYRAALCIDPEDADTHFNLAELLKDHLGRPTEVAGRAPTYCVYADPREMWHCSAILYSWHITCCQGVQNDVLWMPSHTALARLRNTIGRPCG